MEYQHFSRLVNRITEHVIGFIYKDGKEAPEIPHPIVKHFNDCKGPPFFPRIGCKQYKNISEDPLISEWVLIVTPPDRREISGFLF
jgi:hypothetical protein